MNQVRVNKNPSFVSLPYEHGLLYDYKGIELHGLMNGEKYPRLRGDGLFGFVISGALEIVYQNGEHYKLTPGQYFAAKAEDVAVYSIDGFAFVIKVPDYNPMFTIGGQIEREGRLKYIDGCTDSLLVPPVKKGDPCFNHLHFPPGIDQTMHTHPSVRIGAVVKGNGECITPFGNAPLVTGNLFIILPGDGRESIGEDGKRYLDGSRCFVRVSPYLTFQTR